MAEFDPTLILLLRGDPADAVSRALIADVSGLGRQLVVVPAEQLFERIRFGPTWTLDGQSIDPSRIAVVSRLPMTDAPIPGAPPDRAAWSRLRRELGRCGYASGLPTPTSVMGCYGSLVDQWEDLPRIVPGTRVPAHAFASSPVPLDGNVHSVNRWALYHLGVPRGDVAAASLPPQLRVDYVRPRARLVHLAQVGDTMFFPNAPPEMASADADSMVAFARSLAAVSPQRILEHAFFVGDGRPVFYSTCPVPIVSGRHPTYPELVIQGLRNDIRKWGGRPRP